MTEPKPKRPRDPSQLAKSIVDIATGEGDNKIQETTHSERRSSTDESKSPSTKK